jgi:hypothetical protein
MGEGKKEPYRFSSGPTTGLSIRVCDGNKHTHMYNSSSCGGVDVYNETYA